MDQRLLGSYLGRPYGGSFFYGGNRGYRGRETFHGGDRGYRGREFFNSRDTRDRGRNDNRRGGGSENGFRRR